MTDHEVRLARNHSMEWWSARIRWGTDFHHSKVRDHRVMLFGPKYCASAYIGHRCSFSLAHGVRLGKRQ